MIQLDIDNYCENCKVFEPVKSTTILSDLTSPILTNTIVECENKERCANIYRAFERQNGVSNKIKIYVTGCESQRELIHDVVVAYNDSGSNEARAKVFRDGETDAHTSFNNVIWADKVIFIVELGIKQPFDVAYELKLTKFLKRRVDIYDDEVDVRRWIKHINMNWGTR